MRFTAWLSLRGKTSPAPGEDVTAGDKKGNLARERLRGRLSREKGVLKSPQAFQNPKIKIILPLNMARAQAEAISNYFFFSCSSSPSCGVM